MLNFTLQVLGDSKDICKNNYILQISRTQDSGNMKLEKFRKIK